MTKIKIEIKPVEVVAWSWKRMRQKMLVFFNPCFTSLLIILGPILFIKVFLGVLAYFTINISTLPLLMAFCQFLVALAPFFVAAFSFTLIIVCLIVPIAIFAGLIGGWSGEMLPEHIRVLPNQGIRHSAQNSLRVGLISGLGGGLLCGLYIGFISVSYQVVGATFSGLYDFTFRSINDVLFYAISNIAYSQPAPIVFESIQSSAFLLGSFQQGMLLGSAIGLIVGLIVWYRLGGIACFQHLALRFLLWRAGFMPWHYPRFLDEAAEHLLLTKVGGGYLFVHRLLLEYFASLDDQPPIENKAATLLPASHQGRVPLQKRTAHHRGKEQSKRF